MDDFYNILDDLMNGWTPEFNADVYDLLEYHSFKGEELKVKTSVLYNCEMLEYGNAVFYLN